MRAVGRIGLSEDYVPRTCHNPLSLLFPAQCRSEQFQLIAMLAQMVWPKGQRYIPYGSSSNFSFPNDYFHELDLDTDLGYFALDEDRLRNFHVSVPLDVAQTTMYYSSRLTKKSIRKPSIGTSIGELIKPVDMGTWLTYAFLRVLIGISRRFLGERVGFFESYATGLLLFIYAGNMRIDRISVKEEPPFEGIKELKTLLRSGSLHLKITKLSYVDVQGQKALKGSPFYDLREATRNNIQYTESNDSLTWCERLHGDVRSVFIASTHLLHDSACDMSCIRGRLMHALSREAKGVRELFPPYWTVQLFRRFSNMREQNRAMVLSMALPGIRHNLRNRIKYLGTGKCAAERPTFRIPVAEVADLCTVFVATLLPACLLFVCLEFLVHRMVSVLSMRLRDYMPM